MDNVIQTLRHAGLTEAQAKTYFALLQQGPCEPVQLAESTGESRTNTYMLCERLIELGLVVRINGKKTTYEVTHPSALETLVEKRRKQVQKSEKLVHENVAELIDTFFKTRNTPGVVTRFGREGIAAVYDEIIECGQDQQYLQSPDDSAYMGEQFYKDFGVKKRSRGIQSRVISIADAKTRSAHPKERELMEGIAERTWLIPGSYTAPVEWVVQENKVTIITFKEQPITLTIHSEQIADSVRQLFDLVRKNRTTV